VRILVHRKKTGDTYGSIDSYGDSPSDVKTYVKENKLHGRRLLKESINAIVRGYDENSENKHTAQHTADFLEILIVSSRRERPEELLTKANRAGHSVSSRLNTYARVKQD
jgi:hypothetical protein